MILIITYVKRGRSIIQPKWENSSEWNQCVSEATFYQRTRDKNCRLDQCYESMCDYQNKILYINILGNKIQCPYERRSIDIDTQNN